MLLLEDLHWADEATLALMHAADDVLRDCRMLVVATTRPTLLEHHPHWGEGLDFHSRLSLKSLSRRETRRLVDEILQRADEVPAALSDLVVMASEGNPFYVEELVNWFLEADVIATDGDVWHVRDRTTRTGQGAGDPAQRAAGSPRRPVHLRAAGAAARLGHRTRLLGRRRGVARGDGDDRHPDRGPGRHRTRPPARPRRRVPA